MRFIKKLAVCAAVGAILGVGPVAAADKAPIKFATPLDFTAVYTFLTDEYSQGQRDYITLVNEQGGIDGHPVDLSVSDTGNQPQRGIEAYNRAKRDGAILVDFLSTPVARAMVDRANEDGVVMITALHGRGDASDGETFPFVFPAMATYWSQAATLVDYMQKAEGGLKGKKIAHVYIDSPFGREPIPVLEALSSELDFTLKTFPYASPGNEQSSTWSEVRRYKPDFVIIWGAGGGQAVSVRDAIRNGLSPEQIYSVVWLAEADMDKVGRDVAKGVRKFQPTVSGTDTPVIKAIQEKVVDAGKGAGPKESVGRTYYNIGVATMAIPVEAARLALKEFGEPLTSDKLRKGFELIKDFDAQGLMPPVTFSAQDHQGGGLGRVAEWDGNGWKPLNDWHASYQDVVWKEIREGAKDYKENKK
ncbi:ABC transporter substrate-binding protein [Castellaniella sp.]|uniref:ABC transporter substrate-binding protein n=1 Tax=Castellaniella sp. TaxID=1955812 RepID=UPI002B00072F|nr:ABC transporter substrate-binding protein [Castellaniella sp.]